MGRARQIAGRGNNDSLVLDSSAASTDVGELLLLDATDASSSNTGFSILQEDATTTHQPTAEELARPIRNINSGGKGPTGGNLIPYGIKVNQDSAQGVSQNTWTEVTYDEIIDGYGGSDDYSTSTGRFTPTIPGVYFIKFAILQSCSSSSLQYSGIRVNGLRDAAGKSLHSYSDVYRGGNSGSNNTSGGCATLFLGVGDYISVWMYNSDASSPTSVGSNEGFSTMDIMLLHRMD